MDQKRLTIFCIVLALWPVMAWMITRYADRSDDPLGIVALAVFLALQVFGKVSGGNTADNADNAVKNEGVADTQDARTPAAIRFDCQQAFLAGLLAAYCLSLAWAPKAIQAFLGLSIAGFAFANVCGLNLLFADWCLLYLALPIVSSLNFFIGYPLRILITNCAAACLRFDGFHVSSVGVLLQWNSYSIEVDPPCSGVKMLWFAVFLAAAVGSLLRLKVSRATPVILLAVVGALASNVLRVTSIFLVETHIVNFPTWMNSAAIAHEGVGAGIYFLLAIVILAAGMCLSPSSENQPMTVANAIGEDKQREHATKNGAKPEKPEKGVTLEKASWTGARVVGSSAITLIALAAAILPFFRLPIEERTSSNAFCGWPQEFEGRPLKQLSDSDALRQFSNGFPGRVGLFSNGQDVVCLRWITSETRQVHPAADCYRGLGYEINYRSSLVDNRGIRWNRFEAAKNGRHVYVRERIFDATGQSWDDVSAWYWSALLGKTRPAWWSVTVTSHA